MQLTLPIPSPNHYWDAIRGKLGQRIVKCNTCPLKKSGISNIFCQKLTGTKLSAAKIFSPDQ